MEPGDPAGEPAEVYNCRCTLGYFYPDFEKGTDEIDNEAEEIYLDFEPRVIHNENEIYIERSIGAKAKNYDIILPDGSTTHFTEGTRITNVQVIAGGDLNRKIDIIDLYLEEFPETTENDWTKRKGMGYIDYGGESFKAELHWMHGEGVGNLDFKIKPDPAGNWFLDDED